jgi:hypothetical protein
MLLRMGDRLTDETGEYEIIGRRTRRKWGKTFHVRVKRVDNAEVTMMLIDSNSTLSPSLSDLIAALTENRAEMDTNPMTTISQPTTRITAEPSVPQLPFGFKPVANIVTMFAATRDVDCECATSNFDVGELTFPLYANWCGAGSLRAAAPMSRNTAMVPTYI